MEAIDKAHIEDRLADWRDRVEDLYSTLDSWLQNDNMYRIERSTPVFFNEEIIGKFDVDDAQLPSANLFRNNKLVASLKPKGLWAIGANGRVDLISKSKLIMLLDLSEQHKDSKWVIVYSKNRKKRLPLNKSNLIKVLNSL